MRIIAFDPGETTGFAIADISGMFTLAPKIVSIRLGIVGEFVGLSDLWKHIRPEWLILDSVHQVVIEDYIIYPNRAMSHTGSKVLTARTIGHIEFATYFLGGESLHNNIAYQTASMAKSRWPDARLTKYLGSHKHISNHKRDAIRHLLTWVERKYQLPLEVIT